ncbi:unnamed protein product, partial [Larinioides sclopetarius]
RFDFYPAEHLDQRQQSEALKLLAEDYLNKEKFQNQKWKLMISQMSQPMQISPEKKLRKFMFLI